MVDEFPQAEVPRQGGRKEQPGIGHQAAVVEGDLDPVGVVAWQHLLGAPFPGPFFCYKTIISDSEEHPLASSRTVPKAVLRWIRAKESYESQRHSFEQLSASFKVSPGSATRALDTAAPVEGVLDTIGDGTASIRGLPAPPALTWGFQTRAQFQAVVETQVLSDETRGETERLQRLCSVLDLCEVSANLFPITVELITEGVLGYYQKGDKSLTMVSDQAKLDLLAALTYAHEYAHALQDERFDLTALVPAEDTFDASKALLALKEGDARLSEYLFYETLPLEQQTETAELLRSRTQEFSRSPAVARAPRIIKQTFGWEFGAGAEFVFRLYLEGGFEAVNKAFQRPPQSTEQVLHPEKYLAGEPVRATPPPDLEAALGLGWKTADEGVLGELLTGIHLGAFLPGERAKEAAAGWAGTVTRC